MAILPKGIEDSRPKRSPPPKAPSSKMLGKMAAAAKDWQIADVETLCKQVGLKCMPPRGGGSHYRVWSDEIAGILTVPAKRPIKPPYIKTLVSLARAHLKHLEAERENGKS